MDFKLHLKKYLNDEEINSLLESFNDEDKHSLLLNTSKINNEDFLNLYENITSHPLVKNGYYYDKNEYQFGKLFMHDAGVYYLQEPSAMIVASLLQPNENDIVLDMCAAPGGKTIQASLLMENKGLIFANDLSYARAKILLFIATKSAICSPILIPSIKLPKKSNLYKNPVSFPET